MSRVKWFICLFVLISAIMFPASAFASNGHSDKNDERFFSSFFSNKDNQSNWDWDWDWDDRDDDRDRDFWKKKEKEFKDWFDKNKNHPPESKDIWKDWFCY